MGMITKSENSRVKAFDSVEIGRVELHDSLLKRRRDINITRSLPHQYRECERTGRIDNFRIAAGLKRGKYCGRLASDSDVYKWLEGVAWTLASQEDPNLKAEAEEVIGLIGQSQEASGYLNTAFLHRTGDRWTDMENGHELYCGGHLIQAAIAYHRATGEDRLLNVATRWADYIVGYFGPQAHRGTSGHPEIEMALVELYRETGNAGYLELTRYFVEMRGRNVLSGSSNKQDHAPVNEQTTVEGHAVRQLYLSAGLTDLYAETGDASLLSNLKKQWVNFTSRRMAITGGAGSRYSGEAFGLDFEIPNRTGYYETCAAIASFMWNWRMLQATGEARCADVMEQALYNGILSGVSLDGETYFYTNPLEHHGDDGAMGLSRRRNSNLGSNRRSTEHWDRTACCPPNMARLLGGLPGYIYGVSNDALYIHHYTHNTAILNVEDARIKVVQKTRYPWDGAVSIEVRPEHQREFVLAMRIPGWARGADIQINGVPAQRSAVPGTYHRIARRWLPGDHVTMTLPLPVEKVRAHPRLSHNSGCVALKRGPVIYCIESADYPGENIFSLVLPDNGELAAHEREDILGGVTVILGEALRAPFTPEELYRPARPDRTGRAELFAIPYFTWANRRAGAMRLWLPVI